MDGPNIHSDNVHIHVGVDSSSIDDTLVTDVIVLEGLILAEIYENIGGKVKEILLNTIRVCEKVKVTKVLLNIKGFEDVEMSDFLYFLNSAVGVVSEVMDTITVSVYNKKSIVGRFSYFSNKKNECSGRSSGPNCRLEYFRGIPSERNMRNNGRSL